LPHHKKAQNIVVRPASLADYDQLNDDTEHHEDTDTHTPQIQEQEHDDNT